MQTRCVLKRNTAVRTLWRWLLQERGKGFVVWI